MQFLSISLIIDLHEELINQFGGLRGIHDKRLLESALVYPQLLYSIGIEHDKHILAASYCFHIISNHPFIDGNKRIGTLAMLTFLRINEILCHPSNNVLYKLAISNNVLYKLAISIATSKISEKEIASILKKYSI